jgi:osmoprotectant transport system permease protein
MRALLLVFSLLPVLGQTTPVIVGSKEFTESVILGEILTQWLKTAGIEAEHRVDLGGTEVLWAALKSGAIDVYAEYVGTIEKEIFSTRDRHVPFDLEKELGAFNVAVSRPLGFSNSYGIGMRREKAQKLGIAKISELRDHPELSFVFSSGFMDRPDGWPGLRDHYHLPQSNVRGIQHAFAYPALVSNAFDVTDVYTTDAEVAEYDIRVLEDDAHFFPPYDALFLYRSSLSKEHPRFLAAMNQLANSISDKQMRELNRQVIIQKKSEAEAASLFLKQHFDVSTQNSIETPFGRMFRQGRQHLFMVLVSMTAAIAVAIPLGVFAARRRNLGRLILSFSGVVQTIPSLALLVFMIPFLGIGTLPAIVALFLYSLLPIVRSTSTGLLNIPLALEESARVIGLPQATILFSIELPLASREILAGIKTATVINIGTATLGAIIGSGGFGEAILTGIRLNDISLILQGAIPAALMALVAQALFEWLDHAIIPLGLRLKSGYSRRI